MKLGIWDSLWIALAIISVIGLIVPAYVRKNRLRQWRENLQIDKHEAVYEQLYHQINGFEKSKQARQHHDELALTYGEIQFQSFIALISLCKPVATTIFYDLGSGTGKTVISAAMVFPLKKSIGIECLKTLDDIAKKIKQDLISINDYKDKKSVIQFQHNDFLECDWDDGTLIFINSTTIIGALWAQLLVKLERLQQNTIVITTTKSIPLESFQLIYCTDVLMSWGIVTAYIHKKTE